MRTKATILALAAMLGRSAAQDDLGASFSDKPFRYHEVEVYEPSTQEGRTAVLRMEYAKAKILTPQSWPPELRARARVYEIDLVYTKYPRDTGD
ncbi:MAG: hypothetical protein RMM53_13380, partial [Bacteroidia bacterium]|nr:hypothetical protein [Bacteroidia bacterium]